MPKETVPTAITPITSAHIAALTAKVDAASAPRHWRWPEWPAGLAEVDGMYAWEGDDPISRDEFRQAVAALGDDGTTGVRLLHDLEWSGALDLTSYDMGGLVAELFWQADHREAPELPRWLWVEFLRDNGYSEALERTARPGTAQTLYRGCWPEVIALDDDGRRIAFDEFGRTMDPETVITEVIDSRRGVAWSQFDLDARPFAFGGGRGQIEPGVVLMATVEPEYLLAFDPVDGEFLIDPAGLTNVAVTSARP